MSKKSKRKILVILPAYNAEKTLEKTYKNIPKHLIDEILLVDDGSRDRTSQLSKKLGMKTIVHKRNFGYGANQKTCYKYALENNFDYIIMLHPDGQYSPFDLEKFIQALDSGKGDLILGSRFLKKGDINTPLYKSFSIRVITLFFNLILGTNLSEVNTGYRGFSKKLLTGIPFEKNGNGYIFDPQVIIQAVNFGFKIADVAVTKEYNTEACSPNFKKSVEHGLENLLLLIEYLLNKYNLYKISFLHTP